jgi:hypothetical protein
MLLDSLNNTIIGISTLMIAFESLKPGILCNFQGNSVLDTKLFKFSDYTISNEWDTLAEKTIHRRLEDIEFILDREVNKVGIKQYPIWWT